MMHLFWFNRVFRRSQRSRPAEIECPFTEVKDDDHSHTRGLIKQAARRAAQQPHKTGSSDIALITLNDDLTFLRKSLAGYEIIERIHHGGQGIVYRARQCSTNRIVAIKLLLHGPFATRAQRLRFEREIELVSRLRHPSIVTLYESGLVAGRQYFAMEFVEGLPIDHYVILNDLSVRECVELFVVVCRAVSHAHQRGIIHRDLKPSNILVDSEGRPHVLDFGLAKDLTNSSGAGSASSLSVTGQILGTWRYLSPE